MFGPTEFDTRDVLRERLAEADRERLVRIVKANRPKRPSRMTVLRSTLSDLRAAMDLTPVSPAAMRSLLGEELPG